MKYNPPKDGEIMGWNHKNTGLTKEGSLYVSEEPNPEDVARAEEAASQSKKEEATLERRRRELINSRASWS